jgi:GNAT superfamily N-acetyltransferase
VSGAHDLAQSGVLRLVDDRLDSTIGRQLVSELLVDLARRYGGPDPDEPSPLDLAPPRGCFLVAWLDGEPIGCGGVRYHALGVGELKRMYTRPIARRRGVARLLVTELEQRARALGYDRLVLETGTKQPEAIALYESSGYSLIEPYGLYKDAPESRCFGKDFGDAAEELRRGRRAPGARSGPGTPVPG